MLFIVTYLKIELKQRNEVMYSKENVNIKNIYCRVKIIFNEVKKQTNKQETSAR